MIRKMRQLQQTLLTGNPDETAKEGIEKSLASLRKDLLYVEKFPNNEKYMSLFPSGTEASAACIAKRNKIRDKIYSLTVKNEKRTDTVAPIDVIKNDDFFMSPDAPVSETTVKTTRPEPTHTKRKTSTPESDLPYVHPSWEAKKTNSRLTGSIAGAEFGGTRVVFSEE